MNFLMSIIKSLQIIGEANLVLSGLEQDMTSLQIKSIKETNSNGKS